MSKIIFLKSSKTPAHIKKSLDQILHNLERHGRAVTTNGSAARVLSQRFKIPKNREDIYFAWNKQHQKSIITLSTGIKLIRLDDNKVKLIYKLESKKK